MSYNLFLDDIRKPSDCARYKRNPEYTDAEWVVVRSFNEFVQCISVNGNPDLISFDHDLSIEHYAMQNDDGTWNRPEGELELTGYDCATWYCDYIANYDRQCARILIHSFNPVGAANISTLFKSLNHDPA